MSETAPAAPRPELERHLAEIRRLESELRRDPAGFADTDLLVEECHTLRNLATHLSLKNEIRRLSAGHAASPSSARP